MPPRSGGCARCSRSTTRTLPPTSPGPATRIRPPSPRASSGRRATAARGWSRAPRSPRSRSPPGPSRGWRRPARRSRRRSSWTPPGAGPPAWRRSSGSTSPCGCGATTLPSSGPRRRSRVPSRSSSTTRTRSTSAPEGAELVLVGLEDANAIGGSPDRDTADADPTFAELVVDRIVRRVPGLVEGTFRSAHSGQDGITPDQRPILGAAGPDGFFLDLRPQRDRLQDGAGGGAGNVRAHPRRRVELRRPVRVRPRALRGRPAPARRARLGPIWH